MEATPLQTTQDIMSPQQAARWYHAVTLTERLASLSPEKWAQMLQNQAVLPQAAKRLQRWKKQAPFEKGTFFADRLAMDALSERELLALLAEPIEAVQERCAQTAPPDWLTAIVQVLETPPSTEAIARLFKEIASPSDDYAILRPFYPLLQSGVERLQRGIEEISTQFTRLPYDPETLLLLLLPNVAGQLIPKLSKSIVLEMNIARVRGLLEGETPQERFQYYLQYLSRPEQLRAFLEEYCILARQLVLTIDLWIDSSLEFVLRLSHDWEQILATFTPEHDPGPLTAAQAGAGDTHRNGRSVVLLKFRSGWQLIYKPRSLSIDTHFQALLSWLNAHGQQPPFRPLKLINQGKYGWMEFIADAECSSVEEVRRFYERQGGYLALLYALDASDFHNENVIASGEHPFLVDLEALFHPHVGAEDTPVLQRPAEQAFEHSVWRITLLPQRIWINKEYEGIDISGLGNAAGQLSPPVPQWEGAGTDEMKLIRQRVKMQGSNNCPKLHGQYVQALEYIKSIEKGFIASYRLLMEKRDLFLTEMLPLFAHDEIRFIARPTRIYGILLSESFHPNILRDALKRERFFDRLWIAVEYQSSLRRLISAERADLFRGDIPLFTTTPESHDLFSSQGERIARFLQGPTSMEMVSKRLNALDEADLQRQLWMIRATFSSIPTDAALPSTLPLRSTTPPLPLKSQKLIAEACAIGDRLCSLALYHHEQADWMGITSIKEQEWGVAPVGVDLYDGFAGIILFLSYLGALTHETRYTTCAAAALKTLLPLLRMRIREQLSIGAFRGLGSCIYLFSHLSALWKDPALVREAESLRDFLSSRIATDDHLDIAEGAAGCLASLLSLYASSPDPSTLAVTIQCGDHLLTCMQPGEDGLRWQTRQEIPSAGFADGMVGIWWSLLALAAVSGEERFRQSALVGLTYERTLLAQQQWNRLGAEPAHQVAQTEEHRVVSGTSWKLAHGIALARLASLPYLDDAATRREIEAALAVVIEGVRPHHQYIGANHSLAYGDCGKLEAVLLAAHTPGMERYQACVEPMAAPLLTDITRQIWLTGVPLNVETPGLMTGLAGIGYQLLRLAEPEKVPSVLVLAPPRTWEKKS